MKKITCILAAFILVFCNGSRASADSIMSSAENDYIIYALQEYSRNDIGQKNNISYSNSFIINGNNDDNARAYFVKNGDHCIGELLVTVSSQYGYISSFYPIDNTSLDKWISESRPIGLFLCNDVIAVQSGNDYFVLGNSDNSILRLPKEKVINQSVCQWNTAQIMERPSATRSGNSCYLPVGIVGNATVGGMGLCWSASCAMVSNYRLSTSYTATSLFNSVASYYNALPSGTTEWYAKTYYYCGMIFTMTSRLPYSTLLTFLQSGIPMIFRIYPNTSSNDGHAIVLRAVEVGDENPVYSFADPNYTSGYLNIIVPDSSGVSFPIATNTGTYYDWRYTIR